MPTFKQLADGLKKQSSESRPAKPRRSELVNIHCRADVYGRYLKRAIFEGSWDTSTPLAEDSLLELLAEHYEQDLRQDLSLLPIQRGVQRADMLSRAPLREALSSLEKIRIVERGKAGRPVPRPLSSRDRSEIFDARLLIEPRGAGRAALAFGSSPRFQARLRTIMDGMNVAAKSRDAGRYFEWDILFHSEIARASSEVLGELVESILEKTVVGGRRSSEFASFLEVPGSRMKRASGIHSEHCEIFRAIVNGSEPLASRAMELHVKQAQCRIEDVARYLVY